MENAFRKVVEHVFTNWTALKLAVEHGENPNAKACALGFLEYMCEFCLSEPLVDVNSVEEALEEILDQEFETICEDGSTQEIANILCKFVQIIKSGNESEYQEEFNKLPISSTEWLIKSISFDSPCTEIIEPPAAEQIGEGGAPQVPMEQEEWIEVKSRRRHK